MATRFYRHYGEGKLIDPGPDIVGTALRQIGDFLSISSRPGTYSDVKSINRILQDAFQFVERRLFKGFWFIKCVRIVTIWLKITKPFFEQQGTGIQGIDGISTTSPIAPDLDFMAGCLGGDKRLRHSVVYWPGECQFYYLEPMEKIYYPTQDTKLGDLMRGYFARCALEVQRDINIYHLFTTFRTDAVIKLIVERAKSILRAAEDLFSATSPHERKSGIELHERLASVVSLK